MTQSPAAPVRDGRRRRLERGDVVDTREAARYLKVSTITVQRLVRRGTLPALRYVRHLRFRRQDLAAYLDSAARRGSSPYGSPEVAP